jgi:hypothetical protein
MPYVTEMIVDDTTIAHPTWEQVEQAIRALDANIHTMVTLAPPPPAGIPHGEHHMAIGGHADDQLIVYMTEDNMAFWNLVDPRRAGDNEIVVINIGGQEGDFRRSQLARCEDAVRAAREYYTSGARATDVSWSKS